MTLKNSPNINHLWGQLIVEELIRNGVDYFCISPGSRSTPLTYSVATNKKAKSMVHFDERACAFHALGYMAATGKPCAIITTSGTAVANLFPAIIEASKKKLPLIVLTADRPAELRLTGAHQTIDQVKIFGEYVRFEMDVPTPTIEIDPEFILTTIDQAVFRSQGELSGPVHLNCMFRDPLAPTQSKSIPEAYTQSIKSWMKSEGVFTTYSKAKPKMKSSEIKDIINRLKNVKQGVIVVGKVSDKAKKDILALSEKLGWPIFADVVSGLRLGGNHPNVISYFNHILATKKITFDGVLHIGGRITSKRWYELAKAQNLKEYVMVLNHPLRNDAYHNVSIRVQSPIDQFCKPLASALSKRAKSTLLTKLQNFNKTAGQNIESILFKDDQISEAAVTRCISQSIPKNSALFLASSLSVRHMEMYGDTVGASVPIGSNRGASGIDGTIASAIGYSKGLDKSVTLLIGDLAFLYDLNALAMLKSISKPLTIVILNNNGGGIFNYLPIAKEEKVFEEFFGTPQDMRFHHAADLFNLNYVYCQDINEFKKSYEMSLNGNHSTIIEVITNRVDNLKIQNKIKSKNK